MVSNSLSGVASISQWTLFLGIGLIFFSWIEKKEKLALAGQVYLYCIGNDFVVGSTYKFNCYS